MQAPLPGLIVHRGAGAVAARSTVGDAARRRGRRRAPAGDLPRAHRDPPGAQGVPRGARRDGDPGGLGERARPVPLRLPHARRRCPPSVLRRRRAAGQRGAARRPRRARRDHDARTRPARPARWRCSARSTATGSASSRSATGRASCAAAPTRSAPASSAWSSCSASPRSAPACAGSRRSSAPTPTASWPASTRLVAQLTEALKVRPEELPERVAGAARAGSRDAERELEKLRSGQRCWPARRRWPPAPTRRRAASRVVTHRRPTAPAPTTCAGSRSTSAAGSRPSGRPRWRWSRWPNGRPVVVVAVNDDGAASAGIKAGELVRVAAQAARRRWRRQGRRRPGRRHRPDRRTRPSGGRARGGPAGHRQHVSRPDAAGRACGWASTSGTVRVGVAAQRPRRAARHAGGDRAARAGRPRPGWPRWSAERGGRRGRRRAAASLSGRAGPAAAAATRVRCGRWPPRLSVPVRLVDERLSTVGAPAWAARELG